MFGKINDLEINDPSEFSVEDKVIGGFNETINGTKRFYVKAVKKVWTLTYDKMNLSDYNNIYAELQKEVTAGMQLSETYALFTINDSTLNVTNEKVHIELSNRNFLTVNFLENIEIILTQV